MKKSLLILLMSFISVSGITCQEIYNLTLDESIEIARHPKEILKIKVPRSVCKDSMMRIWIN